jgi:hypothetical protein
VTFWENKKSLNILYVTLLVLSFQRKLKLVSYSINLSQVKNHFPQVLGLNKLINFVLFSICNPVRKRLFCGSLPGNSSLSSGRLPGRVERGEDEGRFGKGLGVTIKENKARARWREGRRPV